MFSLEPARKILDSGGNTGQGGALKRILFQRVRLWFATKKDLIIHRAEYEMAGFRFKV